jgi:hypothetical protein
MSKFRYKEKITDDITDTLDIIKSVGRGIEQGHIDAGSAMSNLASALRKLESALYYIDRE